MQSLKFRTLGMLATALAVMALGAPAGASAAIGTGKVDVAVDTVPNGRSTFGQGGGTPRAVRDVGATVYTVGLGRLITQVNVNLHDTNLDLLGPCEPDLKVTFYGRDGKEYAHSNLEWGSHLGVGCRKNFVPRIGPPVSLLRLPDPTVGPSIYSPNLTGFLAKPGKLCATIDTETLLNEWHTSRPVCATIL